MQNPSDAAWCILDTSIGVIYQSSGLPVGATPCKLSAVEALKM